MNGIPEDRKDYFKKFNWLGLSVEEGFVRPYLTRIPLMLGLRDAMNDIRSPKPSTMNNGWVYNLNIGNVSSTNTV
jgi:hypothetical protein